LIRTGDSHSKELQGEKISSGELSKEDGSLQVGYEVSKLKELEATATS